MISTKIIYLFRCIVVVTQEVLEVLWYNLWNPEPIKYRTGTASHNVSASCTLVVLLIWTLRCPRTLTRSLADILTATVSLCYGQLIHSSCGHGGCPCHLSSPSESIAYRQWPM